MLLVLSAVPARMPPWTIPPREMKALWDLASDDDVLVLPADKGKATVVMDKLDYDTKMLRKLSDVKTYQLVEKDMTASLERKMNVLLLELKRSGQLPDDVHARLRSSAARVPQLYGLPNVHNQNVPLRPLYPSSPH